MTIQRIEAIAAGLPVFDVQPDERGRLFDLTSHERARDALELGLNTPGAQYNVYVLGPDQAGRMTATRARIDEWAAPRPPASDWVYLTDFDRPGRPAPLALAAGAGHALQLAIAEMVPAIARELAAAFSGEAFQQQVLRLRAGGEAGIQSRSEALERDAQAAGLTLMSTPQGPMLAALDDDGQPVALQTLPAEERERRTAQGREIMEALARINRDALRNQGELRAGVAALERDVARNATAALVEQVADRFAEPPALREWFSALAADVEANYPVFLEPQAEVPTPAPHRAQQRYAVNLLVDRRGEQHVPVVVEQNPTYENLFGKIQYRQLPGGGLETDVSLIQAGSLHRANGGVLVLRATDLAAQPALWSFLKAAMRDGEVRIEEFYRAGSPPVAGAPSPVPVPLSLCVVLVGPPGLYHQFFALDPEFRNYFKIKADIESQVDATPGNLALYAGVLLQFGRERGVEISAGALQHLLGVAARWAGHRQRLTTRYETLYGVIEEACAGCEVVDVDQVRAALGARRRRNSHIEDEVQRAIRDELTIISVTGTAVGQINGLTVQDVGDHSFGTPARISARASVGRRGIINIERLVAMSGPIQQKSSLVLQGILTHRFARHAPLSFDVSVTFEQLYGGVEGDSASLAEYIAIISDLANLPIRQDLAITGSVNQFGQSQVIGGVHHKVEGFYRTCVEAGGPTGTQGVVVPAGNANHLVLDDAVCEALEEGTFSLWTVDTVEEAVELFTGMPTGSGDTVDDETVYGRVRQTLDAFDAALSQRGL